jgi:hypothetical protein
MKKTLLAALLVALAGSVIMLAGCRVVEKPGAGETTTRNYDLANFDRIEAGHAFDIEITRSDNYSVVITTGENVFERLSVTVADGALKIDLDTPFFNLTHSPRAVITMPALRGVDLSGASDATATGFASGDDFATELSGASTLDIEVQTGRFEAELSGASGLKGNVTASGTDLDLSGASHVTLEGSGGDISVKASGASQIELEDYNVRNADIDFSGASHADMEIEGRMDVSLSGASSLRYGGDPTLGDLDISSGSSIKRR